MVRKAVLLLGLILISVLFMAACDELFAGLFDPELDMAVLKGDPSACAKLDETNHTGRIDSCYSRIAENKNDSSLCNDVKSDYVKSDCFTHIAIITDNVTLCRITMSQNGDYCLQQIGIRTNNSELCGKIDGQQYQDECYLSIAVSKKDPGMCEDVRDRSKYNQCYIEIVRATSDDSYCKKILGKGGQGDLAACYLQVAINKKDSSYCNKVTDATERPYCFMNFAVNQEDIEGCQKAAGLADECLWQMGNVKHLATACNDIAGIKKKDSCYYTVAYYNKNADLCNRINDSYDKAACLKAVAGKS